MWWKCNNGSYVNMKHMATLDVKSDGENGWNVVATEISEQSRYIVRNFTTKEAADKLLQGIIVAETPKGMIVEK